MKRLFAFTAALWLLAFPAFAAPTVNLLVSSAGNVAGTTYTTGAVTGSMSGSGNAIFISVAFENVATTITCSDTKSNTYVTGTIATGTNAREQFCYSLNATNLVSGTDTITITFGSSVTLKSLTAAWVSGVSTSGILAQGTGATGTSTNPAITTSSLAAGTVLLVGTNVVSGQGDTWTESTGFTSLTASSVSGVINRMAYELTPSTGTVSYSATNSASRIWVTQWIAIAPAGTSTRVPQMTLLGVGQ